MHAFFIFFYGMLPNVKIYDGDVYSKLMLIFFPHLDDLAFIQINATLWLFPVSISLCQTFPGIPAIIENTKGQ